MQNWSNYQNHSQICQVAEKISTGGYIDFKFSLSGVLLSSPHITSVQYCGGCSVHRGITSVLWGIASVLWGSFSTVEVAQYSGEIASVLWGIASVLSRLFSTVGDNISTCGDNISTVGITSVLWRVFSTVEGYLQYCGVITAVHVEDSFSTVGGGGGNFSTVEG